MLKLLKSKLKLRLTFWIIFDVSVAMLVISSINIMTSYDNALSVAGRTSVNMAQQIAVFVDNKISTTQASLTMLSQMEDIGNPALATAKRVETARLAGQSFGANASIHLTDAQGRELVLAGESGADLSGEAYIQSALQGNAHVSTPFYDSATGKMAMIMSQPIMWNGQISGIIFLQLPEDFINETIADVNTGHGGYACIFDGNGLMIAHRDIDTIMKDGQASYSELAKTDASYNGMAEAVAEMTRMKSGTIIYTNNLGQEIFGGFSPTHNGWIVLVRDETSEINADAKAAITGSIIGAIICLALIISIAPRLMGKITAPINFISQVLNQVGSSGSLTLTEEDRQELRGYTAKIDEIGTCAKALEGHFRHLQEVEEVLEKMSAGDLTMEIRQLSERDNISLALLKMRDSLNAMFLEIHQSASIVASGSGQISHDSNNLAQGAAEQSAATEELSSAIAEITQCTDESRSLMEQATELSSYIRNNAQKGSGQMEQMMSAVREINEAGQSISKVIKVIDDIAFQTNILALNAAVEAARAGQHGKGFAVVAEEVRSLASKSAEAARDTGSLIANSVAKAELGVRIAEETAVSLGEIVVGIGETDRLIGSIAQSTNEQFRAIGEISKNSEEITHIAQGTSAAAEESASAAQEMNAQAVILENCLKQFKLRESGRPSAPLQLPPAQEGK